MLKHNVLVSDIVLKTGLGRKTGLKAIFWSLGLDLGWY